jgi:hypothetical protein
MVTCLLCEASLLMAAALTTQKELKSIFNSVEKKYEREREETTVVSFIIILSCLALGVFPWKQTRMGKFIFYFL